MIDKTLKENIGFNVCRTLVSILYPVVTFVYVSRVISVDGLGSVTFAKNLTSYFALAASLGTTYYGTREGARVAKDKKAFTKLFWEVQIINGVSTLLSLAAFLLMVFFVPAVKNYRQLLMINAVSIVLGGLSGEWVLSAYEKYKLISIRTMLMQLLCMLAIFVLVRDESDCAVYAVLLVVSGYFPYLFNWMFAYRNIGMPTWKELGFKRHFKPILVLFAMLVSIDLYTLLDTSMLGFMKGDYSVGIYSAAIKVPRLANSVIAAVGAVLVPRLSFYYEADREKFEGLIRQAMTFVFMLSIPLAIGTAVMSEEIIYVVGGSKYADAADTLRILAGLMVVIPISVLFNNQVFIPMRREIYVLQSTLVGAAVNLTANSILIPRLAENGAAIGSVLAEAAVMCVCLYHVKKCLGVRDMGKEYVKRLLIGLCILPGLIAAKLLIGDPVIRLGAAILASGCVFGLLSFPTLKQLRGKN